MPDKTFTYLPEDWINAKSGERRTARTLEDAAIFNADPNWSLVESQPDGFRTHRKRPKGWRERAIKDGEIADPDKPAEQIVYGEDVLVFDVPVATLPAEGKRTR